MLGRTFSILLIAYLWAVPASAQVLFEDDFSDGDSSGWLTWVSGWVETDGVYRATDTRANVRSESVWSGGFDWTDYAVEADVRRPDRAISDAGIVFRYVDDQNHAFCGLNQNNSGKWLSLRANNAGGGQSQNLAFSFAANTWYRLRATANGDSVSCEVVGHPGARIDLVGPNSSHGTVGFRNAHIVVDHDNLVVTDLSANPCSTMIGAWTETTPLPRPEWATEASVFGDHVIILSRIDGTIWIGDVGPGGNITQWRTTTPFPGDAGLASGPTVVGNFFVVPDNPLSWVAELAADASVIRWFQSTGMNFTHRPGRVAVADEANRRVYLVGGGPQNNRSNRVEMTTVAPDGTLSPWTELTPMPKGLLDPMVEIWTGHLYVFGGEGNGGSLSPSRDVHRAPILAGGTLGSWEFQGLLSIPRPHSQHLVCGDTVHIAGGGVHSFITSDVESADLAVLGNTPLHRSSASLPTTLSSHFGGVVGACGYIIGGVTGTFGANKTDRVYVADLAGGDKDGDGFTTCGGDCDDSNPLIHPGATEACNGIDDNCNAVVDEGFDLDGDGFKTCTGDCNDADASVNPAAAEVCDSVDNNCNAVVDEGFDNDGDGFTICGGDCNDAIAAINPAAPEVCDGIDNNCDASVDEGFDNDGDGFTTCAGDCRDDSALINPAATEVCDLEDNNCDGSIDEGFDRDGDTIADCVDRCPDHEGERDICAPLSCSGFEPPVASGPVTVRGNRALPAKALLFGEQGEEITGLDLVAPPVIQVLFESGIQDPPVDVTSDALSAGLGTDGNQFVYTSDGKWHFNLKTKNYSAAGTYLIFMDSGDESEYVIEPVCSATFVVE